MRDIAIYGAGGFGREIACLINYINSKEPTWNLIGFFDDGKEIGAEVSHYGKVLGGINELNSWSSLIAVAIAIGSPNAVKAISAKITNTMVDFPNIIHPNFYLYDEDTVTIGKGNILQGRCLASCNVKIGDFNVFNGDITIGHDVSIGSYNSFMPGVRVSGEVAIGDCNFFGVASIILQQLKIGNNVKLGAGSVLITKPQSGNLYVGNPAKIFKY